MISDIIVPILFYALCIGILENKKLWSNIIAYFIAFVVMGSSPIIITIIAIIIMIIKTELKEPTK
jgi:hypothetical protein